MTPATVGLPGLAGISRYRKQCEGGHSTILAECRYITAQGEWPGGERSSRIIWTGRVQERLISHRRHECHLEATAADIKKALPGSFRTAARAMTFHPASWNPPLLRLLRLRLALRAQRCTTGCHGEAPSIPHPCISAQTPDTNTGAPFPLEAGERRRA